jgi:hypothetical protein
MGGISRMKNFAFGSDPQCCVNSLIYGVKSQLEMAIFLTQWQYQKVSRSQYLELSY